MIQSWGGSSTYLSDNTIVSSGLNQSYLLFKSDSATAIPSANYKLNAAVAWWAYDTQATWSLVLTLISAVLEACLVGFSWHIIGDQYYWTVDHHMRQDILADIAAGNGGDVDPYGDADVDISHTGANGIKCYRDNLDEYGNECVFKGQ